ncbi:DUF3139 domain-containing protein [Clostridioides difficile]|uniref:DUF3139 domain-containing protein n=4 Tax=Clostridioides difficile TaxID=1496 RepID=A0A9P3TYA4_CLODI|nr:DUF3139 domain-containing protein [Clostridioides difficile]AWH78782.1 DUF3139 domain-containing protein [Clostridioides difficile]AWH82606.1 DUF3139 domain-containing protein [Clostridioides difficile]AXU47706.1 hypothetical protein CDIF29627_03282 [Clostridioides difficile]AXU51360.1 hypothetical protein CDIF29629_03232 [Clostridioides difficile]AXU65790.1 hypothetical protein CDIF28669_03200 [Clostridioides difficile]
MRKYKAILLTLIISIVAIIGFIIYNNYFIKWNEVEKYIDKYMTYQVVLDDDIERITKETYTKENYDGILYKSFYKNYPDYEYQYFYSGDYYALHVNKVMLQAYHEEDGSKLQKIIKN